MVSAVSHFGEMLKGVMKQSDDKPARYLLVCRFSYAAATKLVALPAGVSACKITVHPGATRIDCHQSKHSLSFASERAKD